MTAHRRRSLPFAFSLRTLFVAVTIVGVWLGWNLKIVRERKAIVAEVTEQVGPSSIRLRWLEAVEAAGAVTYDEKGNGFQGRPVSRTRRLCGDQTCLKILVRAPLDASLLNRLASEFPEAELMYSPQDGPLAYRDSLYKPLAEREPNRGALFTTGLIEK